MSCHTFCLSTLSALAAVCRWIGGDDLEEEQEDWILGNGVRPLDGDGALLGP